MSESPSEVVTGQGPDGSIFLDKKELRELQHDEVRTILDTCFNDWEGAPGVLTALRMLDEELYKRVCEQIKLEIGLMRGHAHKNPDLYDMEVYKFLISLTVETPVAV